MKRIFSKRSGFTLVEILIAFAIFAIMASMIVQVLNLTVRRKVQNKKLEDNLSAQEQSFVARPKDTTYNSAADPDGTLSLKFKDQSGADLGMSLDYQLRNWDPDNRKNGINYFVGNMKYNAELSQTFGGDPTDDPNGEDKINTNTGTVMSRFDTRITGTKGIDAIKIVVFHTPGTTTYNITMTVDDTSVDKQRKVSEQVSLFFADDKNGNAKPVNVVSVNDGAKSMDALKTIKPCGLNGVNIHCKDNQGFNTPVSFSVELEEEIPIEKLGFGENDNNASVKDGVTYGKFTYDGVVYVNIFGAYTKDGSGEGTTDPDEGEGEGGGEDPDPNPNPNPNPDPNPNPNPDPNPNPNPDPNPNPGGETGGETGGSTTGGGETGGETGGGSMGGEPGE